MSTESQSFPLHHSESKFLNELFPILDVCTTQQAFCIGLLCAAAEIQGGYPPKDALLLAAAQDPKLFHIGLSNTAKPARPPRERIQRA